MIPPASATAASRAYCPASPPGRLAANERCRPHRLSGGRGGLSLARTVPRSQKPGIGDGLLDMLQGGPKLRRWYGEEELLGVGGQGGEEVIQAVDVIHAAACTETFGESYGEDPQQQLGDNAPRETVLVLDADSPMGEQVALQLILLRQKVRLVVSDATAAKTAFGPYVETVQGTTNALRADPSALKGIKAVIVPGRVGIAAQVAKLAGVEHIVLLSSVGMKAGGFGLFTNGELQMLSAEERETEVISSGVPYTIARVGRIKDVPAGLEAITLSQAQAPTGDISRESAAAVLANSSTLQPETGRVFTVSLSESPSGSKPWPELLEGITEEQVASA